MLVLDDGWFGERNDDNTSLGDWVVNEKKLGCTMGELIGKINDLGLKFGLWIEPEMVSRIVIFTGNIQTGHCRFRTSSGPGKKPACAGLLQERDSGSCIRSDLFGARSGES